MGYLTELLGVDSHRAFTFFMEYLQQEVSAEVTHAETVYVANVLAQYAQTSRYSGTSVTPSGSLYDVFDTFVRPGLTAEGFSGLHDPEILEVAGGHTLLLVGFFRDQVARRTNVGWYDQLGRSFFERASCWTEEDKKAYLLRQVAMHFPLLAISCRNMQRTLQQERYLLKMH